MSTNNYVYTAYDFNSNIYQYLILIHVNYDLIHHVCKLIEKTYLCSQLGEKMFLEFKYLSTTFWNELDCKTNC